MTSGDSYETAANRNTPLIHQGLRGYPGKSIISKSGANSLAGLEHGSKVRNPEEARSLLTTTRKQHAVDHIYKLYGVRVVRSNNPKGKVDSLSSNIIVPVSIGPK